MSKIASVILAAGQGTRMKSTLAKVLHPILGQPMLHYPLQVAEALSDLKPVVVVGRQAEQVIRAVEGKARIALQEKQLGTAHALMQARSLLENQAELVFLLYGDMPLLTVESAQRLVENKKQHHAPVSMLTVIAENPRGFGRVLRDQGGQVTAIVEEAQATVEELTIKELNVGVYCFDADWLWPALDRIPFSPKGEYYLTDVVGLAHDDGLAVKAITIDDITETIGVNTRMHLAEAETVMRARINKRWMEAGVSMPDPASVVIEPGVVLECDVVLHANTQLRGNTKVCSGTEIGPNSLIESSIIGNQCVLPFSYIQHAIVPDGTRLAPFTCLHE